MVIKMKAIGVKKIKKNIKSKKILNITFVKNKLTIRYKSIA